MNSFKEYEAQHTEPQELPAYFTEEARDDFAETERERRETVADIKASIAHRLTVADPPQEILRDALRAIGIITNSEEWAEGCILQLQAICEASPPSYTEATAAAEEYREKLRRTLNREKNKLDKIAVALDIFINDISEPVGAQSDDDDPDDDEFLLDLF